MFADGLQDLIQRQVFLPRVAIAGIIARPRAVQAQESGKAVSA
jgi:hypothetical protein